MKLTAETITDEQIRELPDDRTRRIALNDARMTLSSRMVRAARARCAEILNARAEGKS